MHEAVSSDMNDASIDIAIEKYMRAKEAAGQYQETQKILIESTAEIDNAFRQMGDSLDLTNPTSQLDTLNQAI
jgi:hypothetical protein